MAELNSTFDQIQTTHGYYNYFETPGCVQFVKNLYQPEYNSDIYNMRQDINMWHPVDNYCTNYYIPESIKQYQMILYIPRYSVESFRSSDKIDISSIKYIITAYTYISGTKIILGSYMFGMDSAVASDRLIRYKGEEYYNCVYFNIIDPLSIIYDDQWKDFRTNRCGELPYTNNTGISLHIELTPVINDSNPGEYIITDDFTTGSAGIFLQHDIYNHMSLDLNYDGNAILEILFNEVYNGDLQTYLAETYNMWKKDEYGNYIDEDGNIIEPDPDTGVINEEDLVPDSYRVIYELVIKDQDNIYDIYDKISASGSAIFGKSEIQHEWSWWKEGLIMQGSIEIYETDSDDIEYIREQDFPIIALLSNEIPLMKDNFRFMVPLDLNFEYINKDDIDMNEYNVSVVNKINKNIIKVNRPEDYKSNIIRPLFYSSEKIGNIVVHPAVSENIGIDLNRYKSKVNLFYIRIEGQDFIEIGRTKRDVIFNIDGNMLPNEAESGKYYILDQDFNMVTLGNYKYEQ